MDGLTITHTVSEDGLTLLSTATVKGKDIFVSSKVTWDDINLAMEKRQHTMDMFDQAARKKLQSAESSYQRGKRIKTPWGHFFTGYTVGGDFDVLRFPRVKIDRKKQGIFFGWFKLVLFFRKIRKN